MQTQNKIEDQKILLLFLEFCLSLVLFECEMQAPLLPSLGSPNQPNYILNQIGSLLTESEQRIFRKSPVSGKNN